MSPQAVGADPSRAPLPEWVGADPSRAPLPEWVGADPSRAPLPEWAVRALTPAARPGPHCGVCGAGLAIGEHCRNPLCASASRWFHCNVAMVERSGPFEWALNAYKYRGELAWAPLFGAMLASLLVRVGMRGCDAVIASPTFVGPGGRAFDHIRSVLGEAALRLPRDLAALIDAGTPGTLVKIRPTPRLAGCDREQRRAIAHESIRPALRVTNPRRISGRRILVFDDVFTDGRTLDEVARALRLQGGARRVCGVSLCRQPWRMRSTVPLPLASSSSVIPWTHPSRHPGTSSGRPHLVAASPLDRPTSPPRSMTWAPATATCSPTPSATAWSASSR